MLQGLLLVRPINQNRSSPSLCPPTPEKKVQHEGSRVQVPVITWHHAVQRVTHYRLSGLCISRVPVVGAGRALDVRLDPGRGNLSVRRDARRQRQRQGGGGVRAGLGAGLGGGGCPCGAAQLLARVSGGRTERVCTHTRAGRSCGPRRCSNTEFTLQNRQQRSSCIRNKLQGLQVLTVRYDQTRKVGSHLLRTRTFAWEQASRNTQTWASRNIAGPCTSALSTIRPEPPDSIPVLPRTQLQICRTMHQRRNDTYKFGAWHRQQHGGKVTALETSTSRGPKDPARQRPLTGSFGGGVAVTLGQPGVHHGGALLPREQVVPGQRVSAGGRRARGGRGQRALAAQAGGVRGNQRRRSDECPSRKGRGLVASGVVGVRQRQDGPGSTEGSSTGESQKKLAPRNLAAGA